MFCCCMTESCTLHKSFPQKPLSYLAFFASNVHTMGCVRYNPYCTVVICVHLFPGWFQGWCWQRLRIQFQDGVQVWIQTRPAVWTKQRRNQGNSNVGIYINALAHTVCVCIICVQLSICFHGLLFNSYRALTAPTPFLGLLGHR